ncbi:DUF1947 domain-containing protein [Methanobrevibacter curvatus]|uniref:H/ACA RNA-protein complex component Cbf5p n=1 Tax=Methanobrevibacter curvatus TaxID=49547 RepID=A0A166AB73_9EURY|nr:RNA-binding protein [Methanobrevibacter curvatus]KZX11812.1 H/ACA RNA-protein complex component Cbf5p [Methanobrevibacter curvatus]
MKVRKRYFLKKKKVKELKKDLGEYASPILDNGKIEMLESDPIPFILVNGKPSIIIVDGKPYPTLKSVIANQFDIKKVVVDMGAVKFMANGADVMSPGIVDSSDDVNKEDIVLIVDEKYEKPLAIGVALISGDEMVKNDKGKAIKTIHYIGDEIWDLKI